MPLDEFCAGHLQQEPLARPLAIGDPCALLDWELLGAVLAADPAPDALVVAGGQLLPFPAPRALDELRAYLRIGVGLCLRHTERCHPALARIAGAFRAELGDAQVQLFVTPGGTHGFGWHYDDEDVFIVQTAGVKDYYFRENTITDARAHAAVFHRFADETSPLCTATLVAGDFLYVPARWWHMAVCRETSLSVSVGVLPRAAEVTRASRRSSRAGTSGARSSREEVPMETIDNIKDRVSETVNRNNTVEGTTTKMIEKTTAAIPSVTFLALAGGAMVGSLVLKMMGRNTTANFVGEWVPTILMLGLYNKIVKVLGSERNEVVGRY
jgi:Cupin superfamily protein